MVSLTTVSSWTGSSTSSTTCASSMSSSTWGDSRRCVKFAFGPTSTTGDTRVATRESPVLLVSPSELPLERPSGKALEVAAGDRGAHLDVAWNGERGTGPATIAAGKKKKRSALLLFLCPRSALKFALDRLSTAGPLETDCAPLANRSRVFISCCCCCCRCCCCCCCCWCCCCCCCGWGGKGMYRQNGFFFAFLRLPDQEDKFRPRLRPSGSDSDPGTSRLGSESFSKVG